MNSLCECGCGKSVVKSGNRFIHNHHFRGCHHSTENKLKIAKGSFGLTRSEEYKKRMSDAIKSDKVQAKINKTCLDKFGVDNIFKLRDRIKQSWIDKLGVENPSFHPRIKQKIRSAMIKRIEKQFFDGYPAIPCIGDQEKLFLDELQKYTKYEIIRNDSTFRYIIGRYPDGHIPELKLFIQFDERFHFKDKQCTIYRDDDIECTKDLESIPGYRIFRVSEKVWVDDKNIVLENFKKIISKELA